MSKEFPFLELTENAKSAICTLPYATPITKNPDDETAKQIIERQNKFLTLAEPIKDKLVSNETSKKIQNIGKSFNITLLQMADISRAIRSYYFGELQLTDFPTNLSREMGIDTETAQKISDLVIQRIINDDSQEKAYDAKIEKLPISIALEKYPKLGDQLITSTHIKLKTFPEPVRPSIKNWLSDYTYVVGISNHDPIIRGNYLFKDENALRLSNLDREKLTIIIKSFEEKDLLIINTNTNQIIFNLPEKPKSTPLSDIPVLNLKTDENSNKPFEPKRKIMSPRETPEMPVKPTNGQQDNSSTETATEAPIRRVAPKTDVVDLRESENNIRPIERKKEPPSIPNPPKHSMFNFKNIQANTIPEQKRPAPLDHQNSDAPVKSTNQATEISKEPRNDYPAKKAAAIQPRFQSDAERISAWRKDLPIKKPAQNNEAGQGKVRYSFPQTMAIDKPENSQTNTAETVPQTPSTKENPPISRPIAKNVVDLREE